MINKNEINAIIRSDASKRYVYSIKRIVDSESLWVLGDEKGFRTYSDGSGNIIFPIWPFKEFALLCCVDEYSNCQPEEISLDEFLDDYLSDFQSNNYKLSILPLSTDRGAVVEIDAFKNDIQNELSKY